jgi:hypothetical protein
MVKTQIQLPDELYAEAKRVAREREMSLAEVVRRGVEYITRVYPPVSAKPAAWSPPPASDLGECRVPVEQWRLLANDPTVHAE